MWTSYRGYSKSSKYIGLPGKARRDLLLATITLLSIPCQVSRFTIKYIGQSILPCSWTLYLGFIINGKFGNPFFHNTISKGFAETKYSQTETLTVAFYLATSNLFTLRPGHGSNDFLSLILILRVSTFPCQCRGSQLDYMRMAILN